MIIQIILNIFIAIFFLIFSITDIKQLKISVRSVFICFITGIIIIMFSFNLEILGEHLGGLVVSLIISLFFYFFSHHNIGQGDILMLACLGLYLGLQNFFPILFIALLITSIYGLINLIRKKASLKTCLPFAPFIFLSLIINFSIGGIYELFIQK